MTRLQLALSKVCRELGLRIIVPFKLSLSRGDVDAKALLPQLGAPKGMLIVTDYLDLKGKEHELERYVLSG